MTNRSFRFGVSLLKVGSLTSWQSRVREAEDLGYDVLQVPDHLGLAAPFPALIAAAAVSNLTVGPYVLNAGVLTSAYLAREAADTWRLTGGRLELGLGAGYVEAEFEAAGVPFGTPGSRLRKLTSVLTETRALLDAEDDKPNPPIMVAGVGDRILAMAAASADIISFPINVGFGPGTPEEALAARVGVVREAAGGRDIELNLFVAGVGDTPDEIDLSVISKATGMSNAQLAELPGVLAGSPAQIAERLLRYREQYGLSYISVLEPHMAAFAKVIALLR
ncbi:TIGR03621 family F420-dependent LLM class oxidoreductase [Actinoplanes sp. NPDC051411]|uniref:TIGR03621 family F420-dependent LLM class oxidoreductase n=1 Tax=Actinoplanes sp. NPDC051411 TaxID=3155522 RepID=UPI00342EE754